MATQITNYQCPACTGPLHFVGESGRLECDYCGSSFDVADIEALYAQKEAEAAAAKEAADAKAEAAKAEAPAGDGDWDTSGLSSDWGADADSLRVYTCPSCGAELICDEATSALDPNTTKSILQLLKRINREMGVTVIVITHEMAVIEAICDKVAIIDHSHIAESGKVSEIFSGPKSEIGRQLILGETAGQKTSFARARQIRVIFNGQESSEPIISNMVLACKVPVNILLADTHDIGGKAMGQMLLQLPEDEVDAGRICNYLKTVGVTYEEVR